MFLVYTHSGNIFLDNEFYLLYNVIKWKGGAKVSFLEKLDLLMDEKNLNKKRLSEESGIAYTTIVNWYSRGYDNMSISIFKKLCDFFNVTMDSMGRDDVGKVEYYNPNKKDLYITREEEFLVSCYRSSDTLDKELALRALKANEKGDISKMA